MILPDKKDIVIPQGIGHAVDRVMFPLPVGDVLQTLQSDRERRFTKFLKALATSGVSEILENKGKLIEVAVSLRGTQVKYTSFLKFRCWTQDLHRICTS